MRLNRILIVDDNERNTAIVRKILAGRYELAEALTGEDALDMIEPFRPDIVLLDIMLPGIDGYEVCRRIKDNAILTNTKVIMVTAKAMIGEKLNGYRAGADDYVTKPFDGDELLAKVEVYLRLKTVEEHEALKTNLLTLLGHETRTPLTYMIGAAQVLQETEGLDDSQREFANIICDGASRIATLLAKVLRYGELTSNPVDSPTPCDIDTVIDAAIANVSVKAGDKSVSLECNCEGTVHVRADAMQLAEALEIILDNAVRFSPDNETVSIAATTRDNDVTLSISDRGPGIAQDLLPHIFAGFHTANLSHHSQGDGLSLAIARAIVEAHGGSLSVTSEPNHETTFTIRLPLLKEAELPGTRG